MKKRSKRIFPENCIRLLTEREPSSAKAARAFSFRERRERTAFFSFRKPKVWAGKNPLPENSLISERSPAFSSDGSCTRGAGRADFCLLSFRLPENTPKLRFRPRFVMQGFRTSSRFRVCICRSCRASRFLQVCGFSEKRNPISFSFAPYRFSCGLRVFRRLFCAHFYAAYCSFCVPCAASQGRIRF